VVGVTGVAEGLGWSVCVRDVARGEVVVAVDPDTVRPVASVGKVLLLVEVARRLEVGELARDELLERGRVEPVGDSGLWRHLAVQALPAADVAALVGAVSDNLATNVLLERVGLEAVARCAETLGLRETALHDRVRDHRGAGDPPRLAESTAAELAWLFDRLHRGGAAAAQVLRWLGANADLSMVAAAFGRDPLAHDQSGLWNKTGTDAGVRADAGLVRLDNRVLSYAAIATWPSEGVDRAAEALARMRRIGEEMRVARR
jgi:beta-lactamase class A